MKGAGKGRGRGKGGGEAAISNRSINLAIHFPTTKRKCMAGACARKEHGFGIHGTKKRTMEQKNKGMSQTTKVRRGTETNKEPTTNTVFLLVPSFCFVGPHLCGPKTFEEPKKHAEKPKKNEETKTKERGTQQNKTLGPTSWRRAQTILTL